MTQLMRYKTYPIFVVILFMLGFVAIIAQSNPPPQQVDPVDVTATDGWSCGDFPCQDDIDGFLSRIQVPDEFSVSHVGQFPGQPMQIAYNNRGQLHATVLEKGTRRGAVYRLNDDGTTQRVSPRFWSPVGIAFDDNNRLYVSSRLNPDSVGVVWQVGSPEFATVVIDNLPCCYSIDNQPNGMIFGDDGRLYLGIGSLSDRGESRTPQSQQFAEIDPFEASILQIDFDTGELQVYASGIRNPYDLTFISDGQLFATDNGLVTGQGDRILQVNNGAFYGFPFWRTRGCAECPARESQEVAEDWIRLTNYTLPRGITSYDGRQFPANFVDTLFVAFWNGTDYAQRIVWIDPNSLPTDDDTPYVPQPFVTGLIRPIDVTVAPDGSLVIADFVYGHIWRVSYNTDGSETSTMPDVIQTVTADEQRTEESLPPVLATVVNNAENNQQSAPATPTPGTGGAIFATSTPSN